MFWTLCITVCLAIFLIVAAIGAVIANQCARFLQHRKVRDVALRFPELLFALRIMPIAVGTVITLGFAFPSFLLLEPKQTIEKPEPALLLLALCAAIVLSIFAWRAVCLLLATERIAAQWWRAATALRLKEFSVPVYLIEKPESLLAVTGFFHPKVFVGAQAFAILTNDELRAAIAHEIAHVRSLDNFKQLAIHATRMPKFLRHLAALETNWSHASEFAADQKALENGVLSLDLASTLVKIGRLKAMPPSISGAVVSHLIPPNCSSAVAIRVQRLRSLLTEQAQTPAPPRRPTAYPIFGLLMAWIYLMVLPTALPMAHRLVEWLVR